MQRTDHQQVAEKLYNEAEQHNDKASKYNLLVKAILELNQTENKNDNYWLMLSTLCKEIGKIYFSSSQHKEAISYCQIALQRLDNLAIKDDTYYRKVWELSAYLIFAYLNLNDFEHANNIFTSSMSIFNKIKFKTEDEFIINFSLIKPILYLEFLENKINFATNLHLLQPQKKKQTLLDYYHLVKQSQLKFIPENNGNQNPSPSFYINQNLFAKNNMPSEPDYMEIDDPSPSPQPY